METGLPFENAPIRNWEDFNVKLAHLVAAGLLLSLPAAAHTPQQPPHQLYSEGDLKLESGEAIKDFSISYVTHGTLSAKKSNAILMVTAVGGNHHRIDFMIGPARRSTPRNILSSAPMRSRTALPPRQATPRRSRVCNFRNSRSATS